MAVLMKRRGFLGGIAAAMVAKPKADDVAKAAGINIGGLVAPDITTGELAPILSGNSVRSVRSWSAERLAVLRAVKILAPAWFEAKRRNQARQVSCLDLDLAVNHSMSLAGKMAIQRERNYHRMLADEEAELLRNIEEEAFKL